MSDLEITDAEAEAWLSCQGGSPPHLRLTVDESGDRLQKDYTPVRVTEAGRYHLLLGDSIARRSGLLASSVDDDIYCLATGGMTWTKIRRDLFRDLASWKMAASTFGMRLGHIAIWLSGNDVYRRHSGLPIKDREHLDTVADEAHRVIMELREELPKDSGIWILGPLPRPGGEIMGAAWETTAAYHLERALLKRRLSDGDANFITLGRALTQKISHRRSGISRGCLRWFASDGIHLSQEGYRKLAPRLPSWLRVPE